MTEATGRLNSSVTPEARDIVLTRTDTPEAREELRIGAEVDRAHLVMLATEGLLDRAAAGTILAAISELETNGFSAVFAASMPRGPYLAYEAAIDELVGGGRGGAMHLGRSRNDRTATVHRISMRADLTTTFEVASRLLDALLDGAKRHSSSMLLARTHGQTAQPSTFGHYLGALASATLRDIEGFVAAFDEIEACPLCAGAVAGTTVPVNARLVSDLLGFQHPIANSHDAIASRNYVLRIAGAAAILGITLSRTSRDLQYALSDQVVSLALPDDLVGSSSMMPQKRNPFLLEHVDGKAGLLVGNFVAAATAMHCSSFTNTIAANAEAQSVVADTCRRLREACLLLALMVERISGETARNESLARDSMASATALAEQVSLSSGKPFREVHHAIGAIISEVLSEGAGFDDVVARVGSRFGQHIPRCRFDPVLVATQMARFGGGPASDDAASDLARIHDALQTVRGALDRRRARWSESHYHLSQVVAQW
jgi:argininosuccinate lyase